MAEPTLRVLHADDWIVAVHKPTGIPSVPARDPSDPKSVVERLSRQFGPLEVAHRLDRDTSGVLVLARQPKARVRLGQSFEQGWVRKRYLAVCCGRPPQATGGVHLPLAADRERPPRHRVDPIHGRRSHTRWRLVAADSTAGEPLSLLELEPRTGRSHQLRVHMAWMGLPIIGDRLYNRRFSALPTRLGLHAAWLAIPHPGDGIEVSFCADVLDLPTTPSLTVAADNWISSQAVASLCCNAEPRTFDQ